VVVQVPIITAKTVIMVGMIRVRETEIETITRMDMRSIRMGTSSELVLVSTRRVMARDKETTTVRAKETITKIRKATIIMAVTGTETTTIIALGRKVNMGMNRKVNMGMNRKVNMGMSRKVNMGMSRKVSMEMTRKVNMGMTRHAVDLPRGLMAIREITTRGRTTITTISAAA